MKISFRLAVVVCFALILESCSGSRESSFYSRFSVREFVEHSKSAANFSCESAGGGGGSGIVSHAGGLGGTSFSAHKSDSFACRVRSSENFDETSLFSTLRTDVERALHDADAQITKSGSAGPANFYIEYAVKKVRGRVELSGTMSGVGYYNVNADLNESGN